MSIRITDTKSGEKRPFVPVTDGKVGMYLCGMTVQDRPHVGHMRSAIVGDLVRRYFEHKGFEVTFVYNFTDVDDKIIDKGNDEGLTFKEVSQRNIDAFFSVAEQLNIEKATHYPRATEHIGEIHAMIGALIDKDMAYAAGGDVYFRVAKHGNYGALSGRKIADMKVGARIAPGEHKEDPLDFVLWKGAKPGEPSWESPWGPGRPGWHIECSAMSKKYLGDTFDIHAGGMDLIFPHHENEIAQSECANDADFANYWLHHGMVNLSGEKMSKSTQHFFLAEDILAEVDPRVVRYYLLSTHYRSPIEFSRERLDEAAHAFKRLRTAIEESDRLRDGLTGAPDLGALEARMGELSAAFAEGMDDDFNSARAQAALFEMAREVNKAVDAAEGAPAAAAQAVAAADLLLAHAEVLGLDLRGKEETTIPGEIQSLFDERQAARKAKDFANADRLRDELLSQGWTIEDRPDGSRLVPSS